MGFVDVSLIESFLEHLVVLPLCWGFFLPSLHNESLHLSQIKNLKNSKPTMQNKQQTK